MSESDKIKRGCLSWIVAPFAAVSAHGGCQKLFKGATHDVHVPTPQVKVPTNSQVKVPTNSYTNSQKVPVISNSTVIGEPEIIPPKIIPPPVHIDWNDPNIQSVKEAADSATRSAARRAEEQSLVGEAKKQYILAATNKAANEQSKKLLREKQIFIPVATVDIIIATSVHQSSGERSNDQQS